MSEPFDIRELIETGRAATAGVGVDLAPAKALNAILVAGESIQSSFDLWAVINEQISKAETRDLEGELIALRSRFEDKLLAVEVERIQQAFQQSSDLGWNLWLTTLAQAITLSRLGFAKNLCERSFPFSEVQSQELQKINKAVRRMYQGCWPDGYAVLDYLASQNSLPVDIRAGLFVMLGQIQLFLYERAQSSKELFDVAEKLAPDDGIVLSALGDYWVEQGNMKQARSYYQRAIQNSPGKANPYVGMGACFETGKDFGAAETWYQKAIDLAGGDFQGYHKLLKLYQRPDLFKAHQAELAPLAKKAIGISPEDEYQAYLDLGFAYGANEQWKESQDWYQKAIALDESRPAGYISAGQCAEKAKRNDEAEALYNKAIEVAPDCYDGYLSLAVFYAQQEKWQDALKWCERAPGQIKELTGTMRAVAGQMRWKLQYSEAEELLKRELRTDKQNDNAKRALESIAEDYQKQKKYKDAMRVCGEILEIVGDAYRGDYHNWLGNLNYANTKYDEAVEQYSRASAAAPGNAVFHRNLAGAYKELKKYSEARRELGEAFKLDDDKKIFDQEMSLLANAEGNDYYAQSDYEKAIERYQEAINFDSSNDVIYSNVGGAWELLKEPGRRQKALDAALEAFTSARDIKGTEKSAQDIKATEKYERTIERLKRKKEFASRYGERVLDLVPAVTPIVIEVGLDLIPYVGDASGTSDALSAELANQLTSLRTRIQDDFGVKVPGVQFKDNLAGLSNEGYAILLAELPRVSGTVPPGQFFCTASVEALSTQGITGTEAMNPVSGGKGCWIKIEDRPKAETSGLELWTGMEFVIRHLAAVVQRNLAEFLGHQEVAKIVESESSEALDAMRAAPEKLSALTMVCKALLAEGVPIKPFGEIYAVFDQLYSKRANLQNIVESIRSLPVLRPSLRGNDKRYSILPLGPRFEANIRNAIYQPDSYPVLAMEPERCQDALTLLRNGIGDYRDVAVVVEDATLRPFIRLFELEFPNLAVLSRRELRTDLEFQTLTPAELDGEAGSTRPEFRSLNHGDPADHRHSTDEQAETVDSDEVGITVFVNQSLIAERSNADDQSIDEMFSMLQDALFFELGVILPQVRLEIDNTLRTNQFRLKLNDREYPLSVGLERDEFLVNDVVSRLKLLKIEGKEATNPANGNKCTIVRETNGSSATCRQAGLTTWGPAGFLVLALSAEIRKHAADFQTNPATQYILSLLQTLYPELVNATLKRFTVEKLSLILKDLLSEEISIRDSRGILESLLSINGTTDVDLHRYIYFAPPAEGLCPVTGNRGLSDLTAPDYSNFVRTSLKRYISHKYTRGTNTLAVYLLDVDLEKRISNIGSQPLTEEENAHLKAAFHNELGNLPPTAQNPVVLTTMDIRRTVRKLIQADFPNLAVLSYQELSADTNIQPIARISWS